MQVTALEYLALGQVLTLGDEKRAQTGTKVETAQLVRKTAKAFVCRRIGVE